MSHGLPGFSPDLGLRQQVADQVKQAVRQLMLDALHDRILHAEIVAAGGFRFRQVFTKDMGAFFHGNRIQCDHLADVVHQFLVVQWRQRYPEMTAGQFLDAVAPISPPTEAEIEDAWELEIGSSEKALETFYAGGARKRKGRDLGARKTGPKLKGA